MKLAYTTFMLAKDLNLDESIKLARESGCAGVEFRTGNIYKHGVEVELTDQERKTVRRKMEDNYLEVSCLNSQYKFDYPDIGKRREAIEGSEEIVKLAADLGCKRIRVFGNDIPDGVNAQDCVAYVAEAISEVADYAAPLGVDVLLEMHGQFNYWGYALPAVEKISKPNVGILYNCDTRDLVNGSIIETFSRVKKHVRHIHMKDLDRNYPYLQLFEELVRMDYEGYLSAEIEETSDPVRVLKLHNIAVKALIELAKARVK